MSFKWFKFDWFTSDERKELERLRRENTELLQKLHYQEIKNPSMTTSTTTTSTQAPVERVYRTLLFSNNIVTVVLKDGSVISKQGDLDLMERVKSCRTESEIISILSGNYADVVNAQEKEERGYISAGINILRDHMDFIVQNGVPYFKGVNLSLPSVVAASFIEILEKMQFTDDPDEADKLYQQYLALKMFWLKLALNALEQSRQDLLTFVRRNDVRITPNGNLVLYRRIVKIGEENKSLTEFISQQYFKVKKQKKSPKNYWIWTEDDGTHRLINYEPANDGIGKVEGNLYDLYVDLPNLQENEFTSYHNQGKHTIRIGQVYKIDESEINLDNGLCAAGGLHAAAVDYNYTGFGDTPVVVLVNPCKAITVPTGETGKLRTTEMFIACVNDKPLGQHFDDDALASMDEEYHEHSLEELEEVVSKKDFTVLQIEQNVPAVSRIDIATIKKLLSERIQEVS